MSTTRIVSLFLTLSLAAVAPAVSQNPDLAWPLGVRDRFRLLKRMPARPTTTDAAKDTAPNAVALGSAKTKVYQFASADFPAASYSQVYDRNLSTVVGSFSYTSSGSIPFTLKSGTYKIVTVPGSIDAGITGINTGGEMVGSYTDTSKPSKIHAFLDNAGVFTTIDYPGAAATLAWGINDSGLIVGDYIDTKNVEHGFLDNAGVFTSIDYPGASGTAALAINTAGDTVGLWVDAAQNSHGFLFVGGVFTSLDAPFGTPTGTMASGINDVGQIAGTYFDGSGASHGFIYAGGTWSHVDVPNASQTALNQIKNNHNVVGAYVDSLTETHGLTGH